ncbi:TPM domain-containing protein [Flavobacterium collinsii]|uniref:TPM_phosphatase domain-containing protein n=1 Tax=Flavobacterium collinsii TaxID=1114861 RepID=A0A9W4TLH6_9FLAO|nr:TPM domain-containing protein [Flavobacterium collinsii]CAI2769023.1 TPM_phosphatase domain-containing protein [Flavobacterium collinsii]
MKKIVLVVTFVLLLPAMVIAQTKTETPDVFAKSTNYVNDFEKILTSSQTKNLSDFLKAGETKTKTKITIVTLSSIAPYTNLTDYSSDLEQYLVSKLKIDSSILIVLSKQLRQIQIQGVNKLRPKMSDQEIKDIVSAYVLPELKKGDYYKALQEGSIQLIKKLE